ncbi:redox-active disulfide protein 2 [Sphingobacterium sp. SRCM116780]|uniref:redox-active disulfide protein 2 n=1 Tax=Sphingobacterium sp. SRCM116780 TaxID=2907623 RepID=UPI001F440F50|nr:redox-active disulfide protein 2 [Sphingobacterium sp. SRCM116780]UIR57306.1 redox-active disulfide protein 2 [Sphingobacterium sp. SRCM116780]
MKNKTLQEMSGEELLNTKKTISVITGCLAVMLLILLAMGIYVSIKKGFSALVAIPFALSSIVIMNYKKINEIKKELKSRAV